MISKILIVVLMLLLSYSCGDSGSRQVLSPEVKFMSDTMFAKRKANIIKELDSLCLIQGMTLREKFIDSLLQIEKERIKELSE